MNVGVDSFLTLPGFAALVICSVLLVLKMGAVAFATANVRRRSGVVVNAEDTGVNPGSHVEAEDAAATLRAKRVHMNDVENIPGFLVLATLFTLICQLGCVRTCTTFFSEGIARKQHDRQRRET